MIMSRNRVCRRAGCGVVLVAAMLSGLPARAQIIWGGQASADFLQSGRTTSPRAIDQGRPTFGWRSDLFLDADISDNVAVLSAYRVTDEERLFFDNIAVRVMHLTPLDFNIQAGKFDMPFGNLGMRRYPRENPLYSLPLPYEYQTSLSMTPVSEGQLLAARGKGSGLRMLDQGIYDIGVEVYGAFDRFTYAAALSNGTVSTSAYGNPNINGDLGKVFRATVTPWTGLTLGAAYSWGAYLYEPATPSSYYSEDISSYLQKTGEVDLSFSDGHFVFNGEGILSAWRFPLGSRDVTLNSLGYYAEGKYTLIPRLYAALRFSGLRFGDVVLAGVSQPWDYNVTEWEGGFGYFLERDLLLKLIRRETRTDGGSHPQDHLTVVQLVAAF